MGCWNTSEKRSRKKLLKRVDKQTSLWYDMKVATAISTD